ncbi:MAG TPA: two-component regulator propeller domain-containing protein, partial [Vicinamibacteria bacterium]|nr:two-component regulator propeller domain-containing protein [Vicinamibacteria bacterium]
MHRRVLRFVLALLASCASAFALDPALEVGQYVHTSWRVRDGFGKGEIRALAQTPDGYLWLGTEFDLLRFDGVRTVPWPEVSGLQLPFGNNVYSLLVARDGALWIGTAKGLVRWSEGRLTSYAELEGYYVFALLEDHEGVVWAGAMSIPAGKLCAIAKGTVRCQGEDGRLGRGVFDLYEDVGGRLWAGVIGGVWRWSPGPPQFYSVGTKTSVLGLGEDDDHVLLVGSPEGVLRLVDGKTEVYSPPAGRDLNVRRILRDRSGGLWIATQSKGLAHVHAGRADYFTRLDGLSEDVVGGLLEDREGNLWVATRGGLDRFRDPIVAAFSPRQGLSRPGAHSILATKDGSVWMAGGGGLNRWVDGRMTIPRTGPGTPDGMLGGEMPHVLFQDRAGRLLVTTRLGMGVIENERYAPIRGVPGGVVRGMAEDTEGTLWSANQDAGLVGRSRDGLVRQIPWTRLGHDDFAISMIADPVAGGLWLGFFRGGIVHVREGEARASYGAGQGLGAGGVYGFRWDADGALWIATEAGLTRLKDGHLATLTSRDGLPCDDVHWVMEDGAGSFWLYTACGLARVEHGELEAWAAGATKRIRATVFDLSDGVRSYAGISGVGPIVAKSSDGRLWFLPADGVGVVDPRHLPLNRLAPPVHVEQVVADRKVYDAARNPGGRLILPALVRDVQVDYTALSFAAPERVRFRYKLEGRDHDWQDAGPRRQAFYNDLPPGDYRFRVVACNNSGVWNETGAFVDFSIAPAYYQAAWFRFAGFAALLVILAGLYRLRLRQATQRVRARLEARLEERERIARDLHDTLLQSVQGLILKFDAIAKRMPQADPARGAMEETLDRADDILAEGRDRVRSLRLPADALSDLPAAFARVVKEDPQERGMAFRSVIEGKVRELDPIVLEESFSIG